MGTLNSLFPPEIEEIEEIEMRPERGITLLVDVWSPLVGPDGTAYVFAPQKGADDKGVQLLDQALSNFLEVTSGSNRPGYGAAGGVAAGLSIGLGTEIVSRADKLSNLVGLERAIDES